MRDLDFNELPQVYGAGGKGCSPTPPTSSGGSMPKTSMPKTSGSKGSRSKGSQSKSCYC